MWTKSPKLAYGYAPQHLRFPGTQAAADATERAAEDQAELYLGLAANELLNTVVITIAV